MEFLVLIGIVVFVLILVAGIYNRLVATRQDCNQGWADIDTALRQRHDLIPNLVETVKGYADHESGTLTAVIAARAGAVDASSPDQLVKAEKTLSSALGNLMAVAENYPDLKASANFQTLQSELADIEDKLSASRRAYNAAAANYNTAIQSFPANLIASMFNFTERNFWELDGGERSAVSATPKVQFK
jgi:LemA protein